jgi:hypothetical protein
MAFFVVTPVTDAPSALAVSFNAGPVSFSPSMWSAAAVAFLDADKRLTAAVLKQVAGEMNIPPKPTSSIGTAIVAYNKETWRWSA